MLSAKNNGLDKNTQKEIVKVVQDAQANDVLVITEHLIADLWVGWTQFI